jgi:hypothetical protein
MAAWHATLRRTKVSYFRIYEIRSMYPTRLSADGVARHRIPIQGTAGCKGATHVALIGLLVKVVTLGQERSGPDKLSKVLLRPPRWITAAR